MKKMLLMAAAAVCAMTACNSKPAITQADADAEQVQAGAAEIVYVQVEAVLEQSDLFQTEGLPLQQKTEKAQNNWTQRERTLQAEAMQLQEKYQKGLITSKDAQTQQESIETRAASYQSSSQREAQTLEEENRVFSNRAQDLMRRAIQEVNANKRYKFVINASALLDADSTLNITPLVLEKINELYAVEKKAAKK